MQKNNVSKYQNIVTSLVTNFNKPKPLMKKKYISALYVHTILVCQHTLYFVMSSLRSQAWQNINLACEI